MKSLKILSSLININFKKYSTIFISLFILTAIFEIFGLSSILLFLNEVLSQGESSQISNKFYKFINEIYPMEKKNYLIFLTILLFVIFFIKNLIIFLLEIFKNNFFAKAQSKLSSKIYDSFLDSNYTVYTKSKSSKLLTNIISEVENIFQNILQSLYVFYAEIFIFASIFLFLVLYNFQVTLILGLVFLLIIFILSRYIKSKNLIWGKKRQVSLDELNSIITKSYSSFKEIKLNNTENFLKRLFEENAIKFSKSIAFLNTVQNTPRLFFEIIIIAMVSILIVFYLFINNPSENVVITISVFAAAAVRMAPTVNRIYVNSTTRAFFNISLKSVISQLKSYKANNRKDEVRKIKIKKIDSIDLANIKFKYENKQKKNTLNINKLKFRKNSMYCIIGPNGSGKTTLLDLICGLLKSQNGTIKFNSKKLELVNLSNLIAYCPQEPFVFSDTIFKNIISERKYNKNLFDMCLNVSCIKQLFKNKADYLNIKLGNNAVNLSGGQKQLINISKTLYQNKQIIIMDEPTSYLSEKISSNLINSLNRIKNNKIIIVCTHNRNLFKYFDEVIDIKKFSNAK
tara:strand:+ start:2023 stop:3735 length:1713 start_codon:yes stop_codon:yes gene_type:complete